MKLHLTVYFNYENPPFSKEELTEEMKKMAPKYAHDRVAICKEKTYTIITLETGEEYNDFFGKFKESTYYKYSQFYREDQYIERIKEPSFKWLKRDVLRMLEYNNAYGSPRIPYKDWDVLAALLRAGYIKFHVEECKSYPLPSEDDLIGQGVYDANSCNAGKQLIQARWDFYNWLQENGEVEFQFRIFEFVGKTYNAKVGMSSKDHILHHLYYSPKKPFLVVAPGARTFIYQFSATESLLRWFEEKEYEVETIEKVNVQVLLEQEERRKQAEIKRKEKEKLTLKKYREKLCALTGYEETHLFTTQEARVVLEFHPDSQYYGKTLCSKRIGEWLRKGKLRGEKIDRRYWILKSDLVSFMKDREKMKC